MAKKQHSPSFDKGHSHYKDDLFGGHHHGRHDDHHGNYGFLFGTRGDDVLEGSEKKDLIAGLKGNDKLFGNDGNDWLFGGKGDDALYGGKGKDLLSGGKGDDLLLGGEGNDKLFGGNGNDVLDGGAGSDKGFGGKGDDTVVYKLAENAGTDACGNPTRDFYDGGKGHDTLHLILTRDEYADANIRAELEKFQEFLDQNPGGCGRNGEVFEFTTFGLTVRNFEKLEVETGNTPPVADVDAYTVAEDTPLNVNVNEGVLKNDTDADGDSLNAALVSGPAHGTLNLNADGSFHYLPEADYYGKDSFTYVANDGTDDSEPVAVDITVTPVNDKPIVVKDFVTVAKNSVMNVIDVLANDSPGPGPEADDQTLIVRPVISGPPRPGPYQTAQGGTWDVSADMKTFWYTPPTDFVGHDSFRYSAVDDGDPQMSTMTSPADAVDITVI